MPLAARILVLALALMAATCGQKGPLTPPAHSDLANEQAAEEALTSDTWTSGTRTSGTSRTAVEVARSA